MSLLFAYSSLPPLKFKLGIPLSLRSFYDTLELNLSKSQKEKLISIRRIIDIKNILSFQTGVLFDPKGNFLESGLRLALSNAEYLPEYILDFLEENPEDKELEKNFPKLYATFFYEEIKKGSTIAEFLTFEKNLNLILFGYYAKKRRINIESFLQYEDLTDPLVTYIVLQSKNTGSYIFPFEYKDLEEQIVVAGADPMKQYTAVSAYRFNYYMEIVNNEGGSFKSICAYMMCLWILEEKGLLEESKGREVLKELVENEYE